MGRVNRLAMQQARWALLFASFGCDSSTEPPVVPTPTAKQVDAAGVLSGVARVYAACESYADTVTVRSKYVAPNGASKDYMDFRIQTAWLWPDRLRIQVDEHDPYHRGVRWIVWQNGLDVEKWSALGVRPEESLADALRSAPDVDSFAMTCVPTLFARGLDEWRLTDLVDAVAFEDTSGGVPSVRVEGRLLESSVTIWVSRETMQVLKVHRDRTTSSGSHVVADIEYSAGLDASVTEEDVAANFPK